VYLLGERTPLTPTRRHRRGRCMSDAELVGQVLNGNTDAYAELMHRHGGRVRAVCRARVWHAEDAEESAQEAVFRGLRDLPSLRNPELFGRWLCRVARNVCLSWR